MQVLLHMTRTDFVSHMCLRCGHDVFTSLEKQLTCDHRLAAIDEFMAGLWKVHQAVKKEGYAQVYIVTPSLRRTIADTSSADRSWSVSFGLHGAR